MLLTQNWSLFSNFADNSSSGDNNDKKECSKKKDNPNCECGLCGSVGIFELKGINVGPSKGNSLSKRVDKSSMLKRLQMQHYAREKSKKVVTDKGSLISEG